MDTILSLINDYGVLVYALLFGYCALKSGALLKSRVAAQAGALDLSLVAVATFLGGYIGDEVRFAVSRRYGTGFLVSKPRFAALMKKASALLQRRGISRILRLDERRRNHNAGKKAQLDPVSRYESAWGSPRNFPSFS